MKAKIEIEFPDYLLEGLTSESDIEKKLKSLLDSVDGRIKVGPLVEIEEDPKWQIWRLDYSEAEEPVWVVEDAMEYSYPASTVRDPAWWYEMGKALTCFTSERAEFILNKTRTKPHGVKLLRQYENRSVDPMPVSIYVPDWGPLAVDLSEFLLNDDGDKIEQIAERGWHLDQSDIGAAFAIVVLDHRKQHPSVYRMLSEHEDLIDSQDCFTAEIRHNHENFSDYLLETKGHKFAAKVEPAILETWLRKYRSELIYPEEMRPTNLG